MPHAHFQIILDLLELGADFPGVAYASQRAVWTSLSPTLIFCLESRPIAFRPKNPHSANAGRTPLSAGEKSQHLLWASAENRSRLDAVFV